MSEHTEPRSVLIISNDETIISSTVPSLQGAGYRVTAARTSEEALSVIDTNKAPIVALDIESMPPQEMDLVNYLKTYSPLTEIVILTTVDTLDEATASLRSGASFYLVKPLDFPDFKAVVDKIANRFERRVEHRELEEQFLSDLMSGSPAMQKTLKLAMKIAPTASSILIGGETGTGKEFFARIIHRASGRYNGNFIAVNCGAVPDTLFESELFGHKRGSFTGAQRDKSGLVEEAHMGTLFLDEVGELSAQSQVKLLRFLQEKTFRRIGETNLRTVDVRVIAASNKNLAREIEEGRFREDLFYRLNIFFLHLPPLRDRKETIPALVRLFVHKNNLLLSKRVNRISKGAEAVLANYAYPGNVRELENIIEHAMVLTDGEEITERELPEFMFRNRLLLKAPAEPVELLDGQDIVPLAEVEKRHIVRALSLTENNLTETAKKLGVSRSTLWRKIKSYGIEAGDGKKAGTA